MHPASADPKLSSSSLSSPNSVNGPEQLEDADSEANFPERGEKAGLGGVGDGHALGQALESPFALEQMQEQEQDLKNTGYPFRGNMQADQCRHQPTPRPAKPFQKWIRTLHRRALRQREMLGYDGSIPPWLQETVDGDFDTARSPHRRQSSSDSSFAFVTAVRSASISITSTNMLARSQKTTIRSSRGPRTGRSSRASISGPRVSEDSFCFEEQSPVDLAVAERALQRRRILEELITTEEGYIGDVRFLMNVYITILASLPTSPAGLRSSINRNLNDVVELHEEILGELHQAVPDSEYTQIDIPKGRNQFNTASCGHRRWRSLDAVPESRDGASRLRDVPCMMAEPQTAAEVAKVFLKRMNRFFIYEEYGAKYELMIKDIAAAHRMMPGWSTYQKGLEVLASTLDSAENRDDQLRKALTIGDLLVKPIQRVCKYPLLFSELLKSTPVIDCPFSHMEIENTLIRLREATAEINRATNDTRTKSVLRKTWIIQDRLAFPNQQRDAASKSRIRSFGHLRLCGVLHVCWQTIDGVNGRYMAALLYRDWLCLATAGSTEQIYTIQACIALDNIKVEEVDNGRGLQCHTARHSWKIVFISDNQLYELILTACSPKEELEWRSRLRSSREAANPDGQDQMQLDIFSFLSMNIKALGTVFRKPGTIARGISIHRATTIGPKSPLCQVILKNTSVTKEAPAPSHPPINRSQSLMTTNSRIPVLAPARADRARLEALLSDVWTRDVLPFPGITARSRSEHLVRASASSMMRKLSAVSITNSFTRRSASLASLQQKEKISADAATVAEIKRRASEGGYTKATTTTAAHVEDMQDPCLSRTLSAIAGQTKRSQATPDFAPGAGADGFGTVRSAPRRASAPDDLGRQVEEKHSCESFASVNCKSFGTAGGSSRPSLQHSDLSDISALSKDTDTRMEGRHPPPTGPGHGQHRGLNQGSTLLRSRSLRLSGKKLAQAGVRRREVMVEGIRSWFR